jgi:hypothetical protein
MTGALAQDNLMMGALAQDNLMTGALAQDSDVMHSIIFPEYCTRRLESQAAII